MATRADRLRGAPTILRSPKQATIEDELAGRRLQSQVQRVIEQLGITSIPALSPQAKGRIERLWQTFQDRLCEMRLAGVASLEQANRFLETFIPAYNQRFAKAARDPQSAWRPLHPEWDLDHLFSTATERKVKADHTISFRGLTLQILREKEQPCLVACKVMVHVTPEGELHLYHQNTKLAYRRLDHATTTPLANRAPQLRATLLDHLMQRPGAVMPISLAITDSRKLCSFHLSGGFAVPHQSWSAAQRTLDASG